MLGEAFSTPEQASERKDRCSWGAHFGVPASRLVCPRL